MSSWDGAADIALDNIPQYTGGGQSLVVTIGLERKSTGALESGKGASGCACLASSTLVRGCSYYYSTPYSKVELRRFTLSCSRFCRRHLAPQAGTGDPGLNSRHFGPERNVGSA